MKLLFAGTPDFAAGFLECLLQADHDVLAVITQPDRPGKRGRKLIPGPVKQVAEKAGLTVVQPDRLRKADIETFDADLMIVVAYGQILRQPVLDHPRLGCINVHASLLPRWRGAAPVQRAILAGDRETGVTLMQMDAGLDTGRMLSKATVSIETTDTAASLFDKLSAAGQPLLLDLLEKLARRPVEGEAQDDSASTYAAKLDKDEARIAWEAPATTIDRQVRAYQPDPVAYCQLEDKRIRIHQGKPVADAGGEVPPGELLSVTKKGVLVACGEGAYLIERIQIPVGKGSILSGADVVNGWTELLHPGVRLQ